MIFSLQDQNTITSNRRMFSWKKYAGFHLLLFLFFFLSKGPADKVVFNEKSKLYNCCRSLQPSKSPSNGPFNESDGLKCHLNISEFTLVHGLI